MPEPEEAEPQLAERTERRFALWLTTVYAVIVATTVIRHEIWQDEAQAWLIARASAAPWDIVTNVRYEGHPMLWHLLLWPLTKITPDPMAMQGLSWLIAVAATWLIARHAPFPQWVRVLLVFGYYAVFEYSVIARPYGLAMLLVVVICVLASRPRRPLWLLAVVHALLACTSAFGLVVAAALWAGILLDEVLRNRRQAWRSLPWPTLALAATGLVSAVQIVYPPVASGFQGTVSAGQNRVVGGAIRAPLDAALPGFKEFLPDLYQRTQTGSLVPLSLLLLAVVYVMITVLAARKPAALTITALGIGALVTSMAYTGLITYHYAGHCFLIVLATAWLQPTLLPWSGRAETIRMRLVSDGGILCRFAMFAAAIVLVISVALGSVAVVRDLAEPYAPWRAAADAIRDAGLEDAVFVTYPSSLTMPVWALLDREAFQVDAGGTGTFARWNLIEFTAKRLSDRAITAAAERQRARGKPVVLVLGYRLRRTEGVTVLARLTDAIRPYEAWIYVLNGTR